MKRQIQCNGSCSVMQFSGTKTSGNLVLSWKRKGSWDRLEGQNLNKHDSSSEESTSKAKKTIILTEDHIAGAKLVKETPRFPLVLVLEKATVVSILRLI